MKRILILILFLIPLFSIAETDEGRRIFEGKIIEVLANKKQVPLPGASVFWKNTTEGTATDVNGNFMLDASESSKVLIVQFVGYETREIEVDDLNTKDLVVELSPNIELNEVVVSNVEQELFWIEKAQYNLKK